MKVQPDVLPDLQLLDDETHERHIGQMQRMSTRHGNKVEILQLMKDTFGNHRKWIIDDHPPVEEVHIRYPCIKQ